MNRKKHPFSVKLSAESRKQIEELAALWGESMGCVVTRAVEREYRRTFPEENNSPQLRDTEPPEYSPSGGIVAVTSRQKERVFGGSK